jgi:hypothetical protein
MIFDPVVFPYPSEDKVECRVTNEFLLTREQYEELMKKMTAHGISRPLS